MFDPGAPRLFGLPPGADFPRVLVEGLERRLADAPPEAWARFTLIVNTNRMARRLRDIFDNGPPRLLPRIKLITDLSDLLTDPPAQAERTGLRRRLDLMKLVRQLVDAQDDLAVHGSLFDLTDSLAALLDEMEAEGVAPEAVARLDVSDASGHWARTQAFIGIARTYLDQLGTAQDVAARARATALALVAQWAAHPPQDPIILAGSTGSRGAAFALMQAVLSLPQGALVLPGFDFDMPDAAWADVTEEDHPQYRFAALTGAVGVPPAAVQPWAPAEPALRRAAVSLSLRPAPATDAWLREGPDLGDLSDALDGVTMLTAESPREEAQTIALRLRKAAEDGQSAALISPDRMLTRQVTAALGQWGIVPDDSAGTPLHLTPPGRFLRHVAQLFSTRLTADALLTLLKHPLTASTDQRGTHQAQVQALERRIRAKGLPFPDADGLARMAEDPGWATWVARHTCARAQAGPRPLHAWVANHLAIAEGLAAGPEPALSQLWQQLSGIAARGVMDRLTQEAGEGTEINARDYVDLVGGLLAGAEVRDRDAPHPGIMIWGTIEARVQGANLVILGGMNDGTWPAPPAPDPWLNRAMRREAGLLLPERRIGLSAHDYQQAIGAPEVWITRAIRADGAETVPSRWINRLHNLLGGLPAQNGPAALAGAQARGDAWLAAVHAREAVHPVPAAQRPSPRPPSAARPRGLRVTEIKTLKRDPYTLYARHCLRLEPLGPLTATPDALLRGTVLHDVMEAFVRGVLDGTADLTEEALQRIGAQVLQAEVPWPAARHLWQARLNRMAPWFIAGERTRQAALASAVFEDDAIGKLTLNAPAFELRGRADRIDILPGGDAILYDYKTGHVPTRKQQVHFDRQLLIEAAMIEQGAFGKIGPMRAARAVYLGLGSAPKEVLAPLDEVPPAQVLAELRELLAGMLDPDHGFTARRALFLDTDYSDYDHLSRFGEWDVTADAVPEAVG